MHMLIVVFIVMVAVAQLIVHTLTTAFYDMHQTVLTKKCKGSENA